MFRRWILLCVFGWLLVGWLWAEPTGGVLLMGPPGAGKGTQGNFLRERYQLQLLSPGDLLRSEVARGTVLGKQAQGYMNSGQLVPDEIILQLVGEELGRLGEGQGFLLDGFPRSLLQAESLDRLLSQRSRQLLAVVLLELEDQLILHRLGQRLTCPKCQASYHPQDNPPQVEGLCDRDQTPLMQRRDDRPEVILKRLEVYHASTAPLADYYARRGLLFRVSADQPIETIRAIVEQKLDALLKP